MPSERDLERVYEQVKAELDAIEAEALSAVEAAVERMLRAARAAVDDEPSPNPDQIAAAARSGWLAALARILEWLRDAIIRLLTSRLERIYPAVPAPEPPEVEAPAAEVPAVPDTAPEPEDVPAPEPGTDRLPEPVRRRVVEIAEEHVRDTENTLAAVPDEVWDRVQDTLADGYTQAETPQELRERVAEVLNTDGWSPTAERIARTATTEAFNYAQSAALDMTETELGAPLRRTWVSARDDRVRATHRAAHGQTVDSGTPFMVGGVPLRYPGDPMGPPQETFNCRCVLVAEVGDLVLGLSQELIDQEREAMEREFRGLTAAPRFVESEHPRGPDGKFIDKPGDDSDGGGFGLPGASRMERLTWVAQTASRSDDDLASASPERAREMRDAALEIADSDEFPPHVAGMARALAQRLDRLHPSGDRDEPGNDSPGGGDDPGATYQDLIGDVAPTSAADDEVLGDYMHGGYAQLNSDLRAGYPPSDTAEALDAMIARNQLPTAARVYRGVEGDVWDEMMEDDGFDDLGFMSVTTSPEVADGFGKRIALEVPAGANFVPGSPGEYELILPRDTSWAFDRMDNGVPVFVPEGPITASAARSVTATAVTAAVVTTGQEDPGRFVVRADQVRFWSNPAAVAASEVIQGLDPETLEAAMPAQLRRYWTAGEGAAKIRWGTPGDFTRCTRHLREYLPNEHERNGACANLHKQTTGRWPNEHGATVTAGEDTMPCPCELTDPETAPVTGDADDAMADARSGAMIALLPSEQDAARLAVEGGIPADELHVTLWFLGDAADWGEDDRATVRAAAEEIVRASAGPFEAQAFGAAAFNPNGDKPCVVYLVGNDGGQLARLHLDTGQALGELTNRTPEQHTPWQPHITIAYGTADTDVLGETGPVVLDRLRVAFGGEYTDYPLEGRGAPEVAQEVVEMDSVTAEQPRRLSVEDLPDEIRPRVEELIAAATLENASIVARAVENAPAEPPGEWFESRELTGPTPITVTARGEVYGHLAPWGVPHVGIRDEAVYAPKSRLDYDLFHNRDVVTADGRTVRAGVLLVGCDHAPINADVAEAREYHAKVCTPAAVVRAYEDEHGIAVTGSLLPGVTVGQVAELRKLSGEWRTAHLELMAAVGVDQAGFPVPGAREDTVAVAASAEGEAVRGMLSHIPRTAVTASAVEPSALAARVADELEAREARRARLRQVTAAVEGYAKTAREREINRYIEKRGA